VGNEIIILDGTTRIFAGTIDEVEKMVSRGTTLLTAHLRCVDFTQILDRRNAGEYYWYDTPAGTILEEIVTNSLAGDGITAVASAGPTIQRFEISYPTVFEAVQSLAQLANFHFYVDYLKNLRFFAPEAYSAPFSVTDGDNVQALRVRATREQYANSVIMKLGQYMRPDEIQNFVGDGTKRTFTLDYPLGTTPVVKLNGSDQTVGIRGVDTNKNWYWNIGSADLEQDTDDPVLLATDTLEVTYTGIDQAVVSVSDTDAINERAAVEGGTGIYQVLRECTAPATRSEGEQAANSVLARSAEIPKIISIETNSLLEPLAAALRCGHALTITRSELGLSGTFVVRQIRIQDVPGTTYLKYSIEAVQGPVLDDAFDFFRSLGTQVNGSAGGSAASASGVKPYVVEVTVTTNGQQVSSPVTPVEGSQLVVTLTQDGSGGHTVTWAADYQSYPAQIGIGSGEKTTVQFIGKSDGKWHQISEVLIR
jgi:hypothetical protein